MAIQEEAKKKCEKMKKMLDDEFMYPVEQKKGLYAYQQHITDYSLAREIQGYINGYADSLGVKITKQTLIAIRETSDFSNSWILSIEFVGGMVF